MTCNTGVTHEKSAKTREGRVVGFHPLLANPSYRVSGRYAIRHHRLVMRPKNTCIRLRDPQFLPLPKLNGPCFRDFSVERLQLERFAR